MKTRSILYFLIISAFFGTAWSTDAPMPKQQALGSINNGYIVNKLSGKCLEPVLSDGRHNGTLLQIGECREYDEQYWELTSDYQLYNPAYDKCLDTVGDPGTANGSKLQMYDCQKISDNPNQVWRPDANGFIRNQRSGRCIDVPGAKGTASGSILQIWDCETNSSTTDQRWTFQQKPDTSFGGNNEGFNQPGNAPDTSADPVTAVQYGNLINKLSDKCMAPVGSNTANGTKVQITECDALADKYWELTSDGFLKNPTSGKCLDVAGAPGYKNSTSLQLWDCETNSSNTDQKWTLEPNGFLKNMYAGKCVDVPGAQNIKEGAQLQIWDCELSDIYSSDQRWSFKPAMTAANPYQPGVEYMDQNVPPGRTTCPDTDRDCISDQLEESIASTFMPIFIFDEQEHNILTGQNPNYFDQGAGVEYLYQVSIADCDTKHDIAKQETTPVFKSDPAPFGPNGEFSTPRSILLTILEIFPYDYLPKQNYLYDGTTEVDVFVHYGDVETIKMCLKDEDRDSEYDLSYIYFRRHKKGYVISPKSFEKNGSHILIYVSEGKHGTYISADDCHNAVEGIQTAYWQEDCDDGQVIHPEIGSRYNVGEYSTGRQLTFSQIAIDGEFRETAQAAGFNYVDEAIWTLKYTDTRDRSMYFCGGSDVNPYIGNRQATFFYADNICPGGLHTRWWTKDEVPEEEGVCMEENTDRVGSDYKIIDDLIIADPTLCVRECLEDPICMAYTYVQSNAICYLKNAVPAPTVNNCCISGTRKACESGF